MSETSPADRRPLFAALACFTLWGLYPLLFQAIARTGAGSWEAVAWRILASVPAAAVLVALTGQRIAWSALLRRPRTMGLLCVTGVLIGSNWGLYIWAVQHGQTLATSLGFYLNPLLNVAVGAVLFRERLSLTTITAIALAAAGVALQAFATGSLPWISLVLASSFCIYGVLRKRAPVEAQTGLLFETLVLTVPSAAFLVWELWQGGGAFGRSAPATLLLLLAGPATVLPLVAFAYAARRMPLTVLGFLQFIQPTLLFCIGALQGEPVTPMRLLSFVFIWVGVAVFVAGVWRAHRLRSA